MSSASFKYRSFVSYADRRYIEASLTGIAVLLAVAWFAATTHSFFERKFYGNTQNARWIWAEHHLPSRKPVVFFASREFVLPPNRAYVRINIAADPEYTLFFNGREIGGARFERHGTLDTWDVTPLASQGRNRILVAVRSASGVGGLLASIDLGDHQRGWVVTDSKWRLFRNWSRESLYVDPGVTESPRVLGAPPFGRWNYLERRRVESQVTEHETLVPRGELEFVARLPRIEVKSGVAVATSDEVDAVAYDFGPDMVGRVKLSREGTAQEAIRIRFANAVEELHDEAAVDSIVFAAGEREVIEPESHPFRYLIVYDSAARATVVR